MNRFLFASSVLAIVMVGVYVAAAAWKGKTPELADGIVVCLSAFAVPGAIRFVGFPLTEQFGKIAMTASSCVLWSPSSDDAMFVVIGGIALGWVSVQTTWKIFGRIWKYSPPLP